MALLAACVRRGLKVLSATGAGARADPTRIRMADLRESTNDPLSRSVITQSCFNFQSPNLLRYFSLPLRVYALVFPFWLRLMFYGIKFTSLVIYFKRLVLSNLYEMELLDFVTMIYDMLL